MKGAITVKKFISVILAFLMIFLLFACTKSNLPDTPSVTELLSQTDSLTTDLPTVQELCSVPLAPTELDALMLQAAYREMSRKFEGAIVKNHEVLRLGEIGGEPCVRVCFETDKGEFVAIVNEDCDVLNTWSEGEEKTVQYWFPQMLDLSNASDESLSIAFHAFHGGRYHDDAIIYDYRQTQEIRDGKWVSKVVFYTTHCTSTFWIDEAGRIIDRTK